MASWHRYERPRTAPSSLRRYATAIAHAALDGRDDAQLLRQQLAAYRRCSRRIIANLGSRELDVISARVRASASTSDGDPSRLFHGIGGPEGTASPMWAGYIHLASHGSAGTPPMRKARSTWPGGALDASSERVTFREVMDFRTSARLVVPPACESGLGAQSRGEGIQGLTCLPGRVVARQWRVDDDATAEVMAALHLALLGHASGLPTQFRIGLSSRPLRGSCENPG